MSITLDLIAENLGLGLAVVARSAGIPVPITSVMSPADIQTISITGIPAGPTFSLAFNGQTTAGIAIATNPPTNHGLWTVTVIPGQAYKVAVPVRSGEVRLTRFDVFDGAPGSATLASVTLNTHDLLFDFTYGNQGAGGLGGPMNWQTVGTVTPTGTTLSVLVSAPTGQGFDFAFCDALYLQKVSDSSVVVYDNMDSQFAGAGGFGVTESGLWLGQAYAFTPSGSSSNYTFSASEAQSKIVALSTVGAGNATVTTPDNISYPTTFLGPLFGLPQPLMTCADPAISIAHTVVGGSIPSMTVARLNGGSPISLKGRWKHIAGSPYAYYQFIQDAPTPQHLPIQVPGPTFYAGSGWVAGVGGYSGVQFYSPNTDAAYTFPFAQLPPATYQLWATWRVDTPLPFGITGPRSNDTPFVIKDTAGSTIDTVIVDQTIAPVGVVDDGATWQLLGTYTIASPIDGLTILATVPAGGKPIVVDAMRLTRTSPDAAISLLSSDTILINCVAGWLATGSGSSPTLTNQAATNLVGRGGIVPFVAAQETMPVAYNVEVDNIASMIYRLSNLANRIQGPIGLTNDANGYPLTTVGPSVDSALHEYSTYATGQNGYHAVVWDGSISNAILIAGPGTTVTEVVGLRHLTGGANNRRVFDVRGTVSPVFSVRIISATLDPADLTNTNYLQDVQNLRIYPPDPSDASGLTAQGINSTPPEWHQRFTGRVMQNIQGARFLDRLAINNSCVYDFSDFLPSGNLGTFDAHRVTNVAVSDFRGYSGGDPTFDIANRVVAQITTATPHGYHDNQYLYYIGGGTVNLSDSNTYPASNAYSPCRVISPTVVLVLLNTNTPTTGVTMTNTLSGGTLQASYNGGPFRLIPSLANACNLKHVWINVPVTASDACVTAMFDNLGTTLSANCIIHCQFSNETWNTQFGNWRACCNLTRTRGLGGFDNFIPGYVTRAVEVQNLASAALAAHGRSGNLRRVLGSQGTNSGGVTTPLIAYAASVGAAFDELALAPYFNNLGYDESYRGLNNLSVAGNALDELFLSLEYGGYMESSISDHYTILRSGNRYPNVKIACYEGGPDTLYSNPSSQDVNRRQRAIHRHPFFRAFGLRYLQRLQDLGVVIFNDFFDAGGVDGPQWSAWSWWDQVAGTGDLTLDSLNVTNPEAVIGIKSQFGGAMSLFGSLNFTSLPPSNSIDGGFPTISGGFQ